MEAIDHMVGLVVSHLSDAANSSAIAGEPIQVGDMTLVVLSMLSVGMGAAGGEGSGEPGNGKGKGAGPGSGTGEGAGGGVKVRPAAVIAFSPDGVEVIPVPNQPDVFDKVFERAPEVAELVERVRKTVSQPAH